MSVELRLRQLAEIQRPFSHPFPVMEGTAYFIDDTFAFRITRFQGHLSVRFAADNQLSILREHAKKESEARDIGVGLLPLTFSPSQRVVYLGDQYKFSLSEGQGSFLLQSISPINFEPVPSNIDLRTLVAQRASSTNI